eukprot:CAMPEP_0118703844 /NCGR_PEP_ID=MMETSP0800-20121206/18842_1 /TAXON_ID=210618 ORGANISM="Striatella unipunctata, Strain CCMP2910" /NCGR_SAMPLE_ID=MMETSP0800 /ASSEMBLY_ACC=CAM_ASM_000638 /LENGTH=210 /DNA_ID=CAMNT_0006605541 /DNA_START=47 /DNA_END=680 /DNA_ORIENTATION=-
MNTIAPSLRSLESIRGALNLVESAVEIEEDYEHLQRVFLIRRTPSELQLCEDEALAEYRERLMFQRITQARKEQKLGSTTTSTSTTSAFHHHHHQQEQELCHRRRFEQGSMVPLQPKNPHMGGFAFRSTAETEDLQALREKSHCVPEDWDQWDDEPVSCCSASYSSGFSSSVTNGFYDDSISVFLDESAAAKNHQEGGDDDDCEIFELDM